LFKLRAVTDAARHKFNEFFAAATIDNSDGFGQRDADVRELKIRNSRLILSVLKTFLETPDHLVVS